MFERFTDQARRVVVLSQEQARGLGHGYIGTEHILLGLIAEGRGPAAQVLSSFGFTLDRTRRQVETIIGRGEASGPSGRIPFTPRAKKILELSLREALQNGHNHITTAHILLAIGREGMGVAAHILADGGASPRLVRQEVQRLFTGGDTELAGGMEDPASRLPVEVARPLSVAWHEILPLVEAIEQRLTAIEERLGIDVEPPERGATGTPSSEEPPAAAG